MAMVDRITTFLGMLLICAAPVSLFLHPDKVSWWEVLGGVLSGMLLIWYKKEALDVLKEYIKARK